MPLSWKRKIFESVLFAAGRLTPGSDRPDQPGSFFLFNSSHIGDLLVHTPLFHALRLEFPHARLVVGCGPWNLPTLKNNPDIDEVIPMATPWSGIFSHHARQWPLTYVLSDPQVRALSRRHFDVGVDLIGTQWSSLLITRLRIPYRLNIRGPGGGFTAMSATVPHSTTVHAARTALRFAEVMGVRELPPLLPRLRLTDAEIADGEQIWEAAGSSGPRRRRIVLGPSGSITPKCWPDDSWEQLAHSVSGDENNCVIMVGGDDTVERADRISRAAPRVINQTTRLKLRQTFSLVHGSDLVIGNSNMLMHVAAAFNKPSVVLLSSMYDSAVEHKAHWGYETTTVLGCEPGGRGIATVDEAMAAVYAALSDTCVPASAAVTTADESSAG